MMLLLLISLLPMIWASTQKVVTSFDCEASGTNDKEWEKTHYGANGGIDGGNGSVNGRLFEFDCQTPRCWDSEGEQNHWWVTCGFSWKQVDDLKDDDMVIVDVRTWSHNNEGSCHAGYQRALTLDARGKKAVDSQGDQGHWGFWMCYREESWEEVKKTQMQVVVDMTAQVSDTAPDGFTQIGKWDTHNAGYAFAYGDFGRTGYWLYLFSKKELPQLPKPDVKVIGFWIFDSIPRPLLSDTTVVLKRKAESSESDKMTTSDVKAWGTEISESHSIEVAVQADAVYSMMAGSLSTEYGYEYGQTKSEQFENQLQNVASETFSQSAEVTETFTIPKQVDGEPVHSIVWFFQTDVIRSDGQSKFESATHYKVDRGLEVHGCGSTVAPNCLPGYCSSHDPNCWTCTHDWAIIDENFIAPRHCGDAGEGCDWVAIPSSECPPDSDLAIMPGCNEGMEDGELCEADVTLPNDKDYKIDNCGNFDVFRFKCD